MYYYLTTSMNVQKREMCAGGIVQKNATKKTFYKSSLSYIFKEYIILKRHYNF